MSETTMTWQRCSIAMATNMLLLSEEDGQNYLAECGERYIDCLRERADGEGLREAGDALDEDVAPAEHGDQQPLDENVLTDDDFRDLALDGIDEAALFADAFGNSGEVAGQVGRFQNRRFL